MDQEQISSTQTPVQNTVSNNFDEQKFAKKVKTAGISSIIYGILLIVLVVYYALAANKISLGTILMLLFSAVFIVLGIKIKKALLNSQRNWLAVIIGFSIIIMILNFVLSGSIGGLLNLVFLAIFIDGYSAINRKEQKSFNITK
ncbi:MAG TPA: hypothetical protein PLK76_00955 [bacterium]|nr:hypothetical protein [bacterium]